MNGGFGTGEFVGPSNPTYWPADGESQSLRQQLIERSPVEEQVLLIKEMLTGAKDTKAFISNILGGLLMCSNPTSSTVEASVMFEEIFGSQPAVDENQNGSVLSLHNEASKDMFVEYNQHNYEIRDAQQKTASTANVKAVAGTGDGEGVDGGENIETNDTNINANTETHAGEQPIVQESTVSIDTTTGIPEDHTVDLGGAHNQSGDDSCTIETFPGFSTQLTGDRIELGGPANTGSGKTQEREGEREKPKSNPMFDVDISVLLAALAIERLKNRTTGETSERNDPDMDFYMQLNKARLEWLETDDEGTESEDSDCDDNETADEQVGKQVEEAVKGDQFTVPTTRGSQPTIVHAGAALPRRPDAEGYRSGPNFSRFAPKNKVEKIEPASRNIVTAPPMKDTHPSSLQPAEPVATKRTEGRLRLGPNFSRCITKSEIEKRKMSVKVSEGRNNGLNVECYQNWRYIKK